MIKQETKLFCECVVFLIHKKNWSCFISYISPTPFTVLIAWNFKAHTVHTWTGGYQLIFFAYTGKNQYNTVADFFRNIFTSRRQAAKILYLYLIAYIIYIYHKMFFLLFCTDKYFKDTATPAASCSFLLSVSLSFCFLAYLVDILCVK